MYDKSDKGYKERDVFANAWEKVVAELDFLEDVKEAKTYWENLRKCYNKKHNDVKKSDRSGTSLFEKEKARKAFQPYIFLQWLDRFIGARASKTNLTVLSPNAADTDEDGLNNKSSEDEDLTK